MPEGSLGGGVRRDRSPRLAHDQDMARGCAVVALMVVKLCYNRICSHLRAGAASTPPAGLTQRPISTTSGPEFFSSIKGEGARRRTVPGGDRGKKFRLPPPTAKAAREPNLMNLPTERRA